jgi:hypothetical protein
MAGQSVVTLGALNSSGIGSASLTLSILSGGTGNTVNWPDLAGTYEGLLEHASDAGPNDLAVYRGSFLMTFCRSGVVSGRIFYNEATELVGSISRLYTPVARSFSGALTASPSNPLVFQKVVKLGSATPRGSEELTLEVSFMTVPPTVNVTVKDFASPSAGEDEWVSQSLSCNKSMAKLPTAGSVSAGSLDYSKAVGRYTLSATDLDSTGVQANDAYVLAQLLSTGKILWTSRMKGTFGTGSAGLRLTQQGMSATVYEGRLSSTSSLLKTTSILGILNFASGANSGTWSSNFGSEKLPDGLEKHASCVFKAGGAFAYDDSEGKNWSGVTTLDFSNKDGVRWGNTTVASVPAFLSAPLSFTLSAQDPLLDVDGHTVSYDWSVSIAANGKVSATSLAGDGGILAPRLLLTLDRTRGEIGGYYMSSITGKSVRRNVYGCALTSPSDEKLRARGWVESGVSPALSTGGWTLQLGQ